MAIAPASHLAMSLLVLTGGIIVMDYNRGNPSCGHAPLTLVAYRCEAGRWGMGLRGADLRRRVDLFNRSRAKPPGVGINLE